MVTDDKEGPHDSASDINYCRRYRSRYGSRYGSTYGSRYGCQYGPGRPLLLLHIFALISASDGNDK